MITHVTKQRPRWIQVHEPFDIAGTIRSDWHTLNASAKRLITVESSRCITAMCQGKPIEGPMLAIETSMAQRLFIDGLGQDCRMRGLLLREYLAPGERHSTSMEETSMDQSLTILSTQWHQTIRHCTQEGCK